MSLCALGLVKVLVFILLIFLFIIRRLTQVECLLLQIFVQVCLYQLLNDVFKSILAGDIERHGFEEDPLPEVVEATRVEFNRLARGLVALYSELVQLCQIALQESVACFREISYLEVALNLYQNRYKFFV